MSWNAGTFARDDSATGCATDEAGGIGITSAKMDSRLNDLATGINTTIAKDGSNTPTADLPMNAHKHTNVADAAARTNYGKVSQIQDSVYVWAGTSSGAANVFAAAMSIAPAAYATGQMFAFKAHQNNTGAATLNINALGAKALKKWGTVDVVPEDILNGYTYFVQYDGTNFQVLNPSRPTVLNVITSVTTIVNSTAEADLFSFTVPANVMGLYRKLRLWLFLDLLNNTGGVIKVTWRGKFGGTTIFNTNANQPNVQVSSVGKAGVLSLDLMNLAATNSQRGSALLHIDAGGGISASNVGDASVISSYALLSGNESIAIDTTSAQILKLTGQMDTASASAQIRVMAGLLELI